MNTQNWKCKIGLHDWEYVYSPFQDFECGVEFTDYYKEYRFCKKCDQWEKYVMGVLTEGFYWTIINEQRKEIIKSLMEKE